jgi:hypothetical protein
MEILFCWAGHAEEDLAAAERGLSNTSNASAVPEIPLGEEPSPMRSFRQAAPPGSPGGAGAGSAGSEAGSAAAAPDQAFDSPAKVPAHAPCMF